MGKASVLKPVYCNQEECKYCDEHYCVATSVKLVKVEDEVPWILECETSKPKRKTQKDQP